MVICRPEDLIIHKVVSERAKDYRVLRRQAGRLDLETLDRQARGLADGLDEPEIADCWRRARRDAGLGD